MTLVGPRAAMELLASALGHDADDAVGIAAVLRLVVAREDAHFGDGIHVRLEVRSPIRTGVQVGNAIHREVWAGGAIDSDAPDRVLTSSVRRPRAGEVYPRHGDHQAK